jgi:hypothetical protein
MNERKRAPRWLGRRSRDVAIEAVRAMLKVDDLEAGAEGAMFAGVLFCRLVARRGKLSKEETSRLIAEMVAHAGELVDGREHGVPLLVVLEAAEVTKGPNEL